MRRDERSQPARTRFRLPRHRLHARQKGPRVFGDPSLYLMGTWLPPGRIEGRHPSVQSRSGRPSLRTCGKANIRIQKALGDLPNIRLRRIVDPQGETGLFPDLRLQRCGLGQTTNPMAALGGNFHRAARRHKHCDGGLGPAPLLQYYEPVYRTSNDRSGFPWTLAENKDSTARHGRGTCPQADDLFARSLLLAIPSCLTPQDETNIITAFTNVSPSKLW